MKTDRFFAIRAAAVLLAGLLLAAGRPAGRTYTYRIDHRSTSSEGSSQELSRALALQIAAVQKTFDANRRTLHPVKLRNGKPAYARQDVANLIDHTREDLDRAIANVQPVGLEPLRAWTADALQNTQRQLAATPGQAVAWLPDTATPREVAVVASLGRLPLVLAGVGAAAARPEAIPTEEADGLLDQVGNVISRIFALASHDDLYVTLWAGSTAPDTKFRFWPEGKSEPDGSTIRTDGKMDHVLRGLYSYKAIYKDGAVAEFIQSPNPNPNTNTNSAAASAVQTSSDRLDLVNRSSFFCCRFKEAYCGHVAGANACHS